MRAFLSLVAIATSFAIANPVSASPTISDVLEARRAMVSELAPIRLRWVEQVGLTSVGKTNYLPTPKVDPSSHSGSNAEYEAILSVTHSKLSRLFSDTGVGRDAAWSPEAIYVGVPPIKGGLDLPISPSLIITKTPHEEEVKYFDRLGFRIVLPMADHEPEDLLAAYIDEGFEVSAVFEEGDRIVVEGKGKLDPYMLGDGQTLINHRFEFAPELAWALVCHEVRTVDGGLIRTRENSGFERVAGRDLYLPGKSIESYYVGSEAKLLDVATAIRETDRISVETGPFDDAIFKVWYEEPGVFVQDDTGDEMIQFFTTPDADDLKKAVENSTGRGLKGASPLRRVLVGINVAVVIVLAVVVIRRVW